jgi:esterase/lipase
VLSLCRLLPAHGLGDAALGGLRFAALVETALESHDVLSRAIRAPVAVVGLSLGAVLGVRVAALRDVAGFVALAPAFRPFVGRRVFAVATGFVINPHAALIRLRWQREAQRGIRATELVIPLVKAPLLVVHSHDDDSVSVQGSRILYSQASSSERRLVLLNGQGHVLTQAPDSESVFGPVRDFLQRLGEPQASGSSKTNIGS